MLTIMCEKCGKTLQVDEKYLGQEGTCCHCQQRITVMVAPLKLAPDPENNNPYPSFDEEPKSSQWYYSINKNPKGPVNEAQMYALIADKKVDCDTLMWQDGSQKWVNLSDTPFGQFVKPMPTAPQNNGGFNLMIPEKVQLDHNLENGVGLSRSNMAAIGHVVTKTNVMAFVALILALTGFFTGITFLPAIVCGHLSLAQYRKNPAIGGESAAKAALAVSYVVLGLVAVCFFAAIVFGVVSNMSNMR